MPPLKWSKAALRDLERLHAFLAAQSPEAAQRAIATIRKGVKNLATHPEIGRPVDDLPPEFREWIIEFGSGAYLVRYRYDGCEVLLLALRHGREASY